MSLLEKAKMRNNGDKTSLSKLRSNSSDHGASQKRDDSNSSLEQNEQCFSEGISTQYYTGVVKSFNSKEGYGFIACSELMQEFGCDVFMHKKQFFSATVSLRIGDNVRFRLEFSKQGKPQARELSRVAKTPVAVLRRRSTSSEKSDPEQVTILQHKQINQKRKRKVSFKEVVEVCEDKIIGDEDIGIKQHAQTSTKFAMKKKHINVLPAKKFSSLLTWKEAKQGSCPRNIFTEVDTCPVDKNTIPSKQVDVTPNRTTDHGVTEKEALDMSPVEPNNGKKTQTRQLVSPRLETRVISEGDSPQTSKLKAQGDKKMGEAAQSRLEEGVINGLHPTTVTNEAASIISKKDSKKVSNRKRVTFKLAEDIIDDSDPSWSNKRAVRQKKKRTGMMKNFGATVRRKVKNSIETGGSKGSEGSRSEGELEQGRETELARLASETFEKLQRVQNKTKASKVTLQPKLKGPKKISAPKTDPAYLDWSLGFGEEECSAQSESKRKGQRGESPCKNNNVQVQENRSIQDGEKKLDSGTLRKRDDWFSKPPDCRIPKVPPRKDVGPRVLTGVQLKERRCSQPTRGRFTGFNKGYSSRRGDQEQCTNEFETYREKRRSNRKMVGQKSNRQQSQPTQSRCEEEKKAVEDQSMAGKRLERELPLRNYKFPRPLDRRKQGK